MSDNDVPPFPANIEHLGNCLRQAGHGPRTETKLGPLLLAIVMGGLGVGLILLGIFGLIAAKEGKWHGIVFIALGCGLIGAGLRFYSTASSKANAVRSGRHFGMFEKGVVYMEGDRPIVLTWDDVQLAVFTQDDGFMATTTRRTRVIKMQGRKGEVIVLDDDLETENMWWEMAHHLEGKSKFLRAGQT
jgi:hypothetical protein